MQTRSHLLATIALPRRKPQRMFAHSPPAQPVSPPRASQSRVHTFWVSSPFSRGVFACLLCVYLIFGNRAAWSASTVVVYPRPESATDSRPDYPIELLQLALQKSAADFQLQPSRQHMTQSRSLRLLAAKTGVDVVWTVTTTEREQQLRPIRLPLDRGLLGWRLLLIHRDDLTRFSAIAPAQLAQLRAGQGHDWPDTQILRANGFAIHGNPSYDGLFAMLARRHIDYFPRAVAEHTAELRARPDLPLTVAPDVVLHYPLPLYFFVHRENDRLATAIESGLRIALRDGSWLALFRQYYREAIAVAALPSRRVIALTNPDLPAATPLNEPALWFVPTESN